MDYLISDFHLDHDNIIDYCDRPFDSVAAMNETLVEHWNATVGPGESVLYGGDLTIRDQSVPVEMPFELQIDGDTAQATGGLSVDRRNFGIGSEGTDSLGATVDIQFTLTATRG